MTYNNCVGMFGNKKHVLIIPNWKESEQTALYDVKALQMILILIIQVMITHPTHT